MRLRAPLIMKDWQAGGESTEHMCAECTPYTSVHLLRQVVSPLSRMACLLIGISASHGEAHAAALQALPKGCFALSYASSILNADSPLLVRLPEQLPSYTN